VKTYFPRFLPILTMNPSTPCGWGRVSPSASSLHYTYFIFIHRHPTPVLALLQLRPRHCAPFSPIRAPLRSRLALPPGSFTAFAAHINALNTPILLIHAPSLAATTADCPKAVEDADDDSTCSVEAAVETTPTKAIEVFPCDDDDDAAAIDAPTMDLAAPQAPDATLRDNADDGVELHGPTNRAERERVAGCSGPPGIAAANLVAPASSEQLTGVSLMLEADDDNAAFDLPALRTLRSAAPNAIQSAPQAVDPASVSSAPAALGTGTGADVGTGVANAKLAAYAASV